MAFFEDPLVCIGIVKGVAMASINILHISDFHYHGASAQDQRIVLEALKKDLPHLSKETPIDIVIFSGDLVQAGVSPDVFNAAYAELLTSVAALLDLDASKVFICPGNHDVDRSVVRKQNFIENGLLQTLRERADVNEFVDSYFETDISHEHIPEAFHRLQNFYSTVWAPLMNRGARVSPFSAVQNLRVNGIDLAICLFNSAWRCTGEAESVDKGNLIIGERVIDRAIADTADAAFRIAVFHHPFDWLTEADRSAVEARLHSEFNAFFYGHVHTAAPQYTRSPMGSAIYSQAGCLYQNRDYFNGYSVVRLDFETARATITAREYSDRVRSFVPAVAAIPDGMIEFDLPLTRGQNGPNLMALLATVRSGVKRLGDEHVRLSSDDSAKSDLKTHFICPPLSRPKRASDEVESDDQGGIEEREENLSLADVLAAKEHVILVGPAESGKTALIHYSALMAVAEPMAIPRLPLRAPFYDFQRGKNSVWRAVRAYANEISDGRVTSKLIERLPILLFVDGVVPGDDQQMAFLLSLIDETPNIRWILVGNSDSRLSTLSADNERRTKGFAVVAIDQLSRSSIRKLSSLWLGEDIEAAATNKIYNRVMEHIQRSGLPRSGYIVSLILWTLRTGASGDLINEAVLLENLIDYMLGKMDYSGSLRSEFDFTSKVAVLQELAIYFRSRGSSVTRNEVVSKVIEFLNKKALKYDGTKIVDGLVTCGIFAEIDDLIDFRYRRFQEFFTSGYLRDNRTEYDRVVAEPGWTGYQREMDLYTSRYRNEVGLLNIGRDKVDRVELPSASLDDDELYRYLSAGNNLRTAARRLKRMRRESLSAKKIDELRDKADATVVKRRSSLTSRSRSPKQDISNLSAFLSGLEVYSQFVRNLEFADSADKLEHIQHCFDLWAKHTKLVLAGLHDAFIEIREEIATDPKIDDSDRDDISQVAQDVETQVKYVVPRLISHSMYQKIGTEKLSNLVYQIARDSRADIMKRLLASFVLLEIDPQFGMELMSSEAWTSSMGDEWVASTIESKLHQFYYEQHLPGSLRVAFVKLVASIEVRLSGTKFQTDRMKGRVMQDLAKSALISERKNK